MVRLSEQQEYRDCNEKATVVARGGQTAVVLKSCENEVAIQQSNITITRSAG